MYSRFQAENFFVTTVSADCTLTPGVDGVIPVQDLPNIEDGKLFYVIFKIDDKDNRFSLPVFLDNGQMKYKGYNVIQIHELKKYDTVGLNDLAENFNYLFKNIDDIGTIVKKGGLDILVYGGIIVNGGSTLTVPDTTITLIDNTISNIIFDFEDNTIKAVSELADFGQYYFAKITTAGGVITDIELKKSFNVGEFFSADVFDRDTDGSIILKERSVKKRDIDFTGVTADDIEEGEEHLLLTPTERTEIEDTNNKKHTHANKAVLDTITEGDVAKTKNAASGSQDGFLSKQDWSKFNNKQAAIQDLDAIRSGAAAGATAVQPAGLNGYQTKANMKTTLNAPDNEHYPTTKAVMDKLEEVGAGDMMKAVYDPNNKHTDAFNYENLDNTPTIPTTATDVNALPDSTKYGATFELSLNPTTYVITATLKDQDGNALGTPATVDLPLESVVVSGRYDAEHEKIVLTLENGQTIDIPVADLVAGLQTEITSLNMLDADLIDDSTSSNKFPTTAERNLWNAKMDYADFNFVTKTGASVTLDLSSQITPSENFTINAPTTIKDGQVYLLRVTSGATAYTMTLGSNIINPYNESVLLSPESTDMFMFLGTNNKLELLPETLTKLDIDKVSNVYYIQNSSDLTTATSIIVDYLSSVTPPSILYGGRIYLVSAEHTSSNIGFISIDDSPNGGKLYWLEIAFSYVSGNPVASSITTGNKDIGGAVKSAVAPSNPVGGDLWYDTTNNVLKMYNGTAWTIVGDTSNYLAKDNTTAFTPSGDYNPATKKYVDDNSAYVGNSAPSNPTAGKMWYDTTNHVLKTYNGTSWDTAGTESNTKTFYLTGTTGQTNLDTADEILQWYVAGKNPIIIYQDQAYELDMFEIDGSGNNWMGFVHYTDAGLSTMQNYIGIEFGGISTPTTVTSISVGSIDVVTVASGDAGTKYIIKSGTTKPAVGTTNNVLTIVLDS